MLPGRHRSPGAFPTERLRQPGTATVSPSRCGEKGAGLLSVIMPVFDEVAALDVFLPRLRDALDDSGLDYEVLAVDDGSSDGSLEALRRAATHWTEFRVLTLGRNRGHQVALMAGLRLASGDIVATLDSDGQHPPELLVEAIVRFRQDRLDVLHIQRDAPVALSRTKRLTSVLFYRVIERLTDGGGASVGDFRLMSGRARRALLELSGPVVIRAALPQLGLPSGVMSYREQERIAGNTKYTTRRMIRLAVDAVLNVSTKPLRWASSFALGLTGLAIVWVASVIATYLVGRTVPGWASVMVAVLTIGALQLGILAVMGQYLARIYEVVLNRHEPVIREVTPGSDRIPSSDGPSS